MFVTKYNHSHRVSAAALDPPMIKPPAARAESPAVDRLMVRPSTNITDLEANQTAIRDLGRGISQAVESLLADRQGSSATVKTPS